MTKFEFFFIIRSSSFFINLGVFFFLIFFSLFTFLITYSVLKKKSFKVFFFGDSGSSSSGVPSGTPCSSSSSSGGKDPKKSFWEKYWKIMIVSLVAVTVFSSFVIYCYYCYYSTEVVKVEEITKSSVELINTLPNYYFQHSGQSINCINVVLRNPESGQYAPFSTYWSAVLKDRFSQEQYDAFIKMFSLNEGDNFDRMVFEPSSIEMFVGMIKRVHK